MWFLQMEPEQLNLVRNIMEYVTPGKVGSRTMLTATHDDTVVLFLVL